MIVCALFTPFALWHACRLEPDLKGKPLITLKTNRVVEVSSVARRAGVEPGMIVDGARSRCSELVIVETNDVTLKHAWEDVVSQLYTFTDRIEPVRPGTVFLDIAEADAGVITEVFQARVALADSQEHAHLKALVCVTEIPTPEFQCGSRAPQSPSVKEIPIGVLKEVGLGKKNIERLHWLGVETVGELQRWSKAQLASYFGKESVGLIRYLKGPFRTSVARFVPPVKLTASYTFDDTAVEPWQWEPVLAHLAGCLQTQLGDRAAARLTLTAESSGLAFSATRVSKEPLRGVSSLLGQAHLALADSGVQGLGIDKLTLTLSGLYRPSTQGALFGSREDVAKAVKVVEARFPGALLRFETLNAYSPLAEFSHRLVPLGRSGSEVKRETGVSGKRRNAQRLALPSERRGVFVAR